MSEEQLIQLLKGGDTGALVHLEELYGLRLRRAAIWMSRCTEESEDILQELYARVLHSIHRFKGDCRLFTWLYSILLNVYRSNRRKSKRFVFPGTLPEQEAAGLESHEEYDRRALHLEVGRILGTLSEKQREVIVLRYFEGLKISEISRIVCVSEGTIKSRLHFAVRAMQKKLGPAWSKE